MNPSRVGPRVTVFTRWLEGGGAERVAVDVVNEFVRQGVDVDLVLQYRQGPYLEQLDEKVEVVVLNRRVRYALRRLLRHLRSRQPVALWSLLTEPNALACIAWRLSGLQGRVVLSEHTSLVAMTRGRRLAVRSLYRFAHSVVAVSRGLAAELADSGVPTSMITHIPNPINPQVWDIEKKESRGSSRPLIIGAGRLTEQKDFKTLIRAFSIVRESCDAELRILGKGRQRPELETLARDLGVREHVDFAGFLTPPWESMSEGTVFVLSSRWEGWGNVLAEAMALGIPVVSTDCPVGPSEILEDGKYGCLVPVEDPSALAEAILATIANPIPGDVLQQRAQAWNVESIASRYMSELGVG